MKARGILFAGIAIFLFLMASGKSPGVRPADAQQPIGPSPLPAPPGVPEVIPGQFIVELRPGVESDAVINARGVALFHRYTLINGFAARMSQEAAARLGIGKQRHGY